MILACVVSATSLCAHAQDNAQSADIHPGVRLGMRVNAIKQQWPVAPVLVIVRDEEAFMLAIERWSQRARFPILYDDGSSQAREHIARFHRAFGPERVYLFEPEPDPAPGFSVERVDAHIARLWSNGQTSDRDEAWDKVGFAPPGIVFLGDPALAMASSALAIGHGQPIVAISLPPGGRDATLTLNPATGVHETVKAELDAIGFEWSVIGDEIDAITMATNSHTKVRDADNQVVSLTDFLGRDEDIRRYAWVSLLQGSSAHALYQAMCSLFLHPRSSWLFNTYDSTFGEGRYNATPAVEMFHTTGFDAQAFDTPNNSLESWYQRTHLALSTPLIFVNTAGNARWFHLGDDRVAANALPLLDVPTATHFIHSFSAQRPADARSILGQWERRGAFAYYGSSHEPFLDAFRTPPDVVLRLLGGMPWACAPRFDTPRVWRLNTFGDPLFTLSHTPPRGESPEFFSAGSFRDVDELYRDALRRKEFGVASEMMRWRNKDAEILRLADALIKNDMDLDPTFARVALHAGAHRGWSSLAPALFRACEANAEDDPFLKDLLWHALRPTFSTMRDASTLALLQGHVRPESYARDASELLPIIRRLHGEMARDRAEDRFRDQAPDDIQKRQLNKILGR